MDEASLIWAEPRDACGTLTNSELLPGTIVLAERGRCSFVDKVRDELLRWSLDTGMLAVTVLQDWVLETAEPSAIARAVRVRGACKGASVLVTGESHHTEL